MSHVSRYFRKLPHSALGSQLIFAVSLLVVGHIAATEGVDVVLKYPSNTTSLQYIQAEETVGIQLIVASFPSCSWIVVEIHTQQRPFSLLDDSAKKVTAQLVQASKTVPCNPSPSQPAVTTFIQHPGDDPRPILFIVSARKLNTTCTAGQVKSSKGTNSSLDLTTYKSHQYITFQPIQCGTESFHYVLNTMLLKSPSQLQMMVSLSLVSSPTYEGSDIANKVGSNGRYGFRYNPDLYHGSIYQVVAIQDSTGRRVYYTPIVLYACHLDSNSRDSDRCSGVLPLSSTSSEILLTSSTFQDYVFNIPMDPNWKKPVTLESAAGTVSYNTSWRFASIQAHSLRSELSMSRPTTWKQTSQSSGLVVRTGLSPTIIVSFDAELVTEQVAVTIKHQTSEYFDIPFLLRFLPSKSDIVPGLCSDQREPYVSMSVIDSDIELSAPIPGFPSNSSECQGTMFAYEFFMMEFSPDTSVSQIMSHLGNMQTTSSVRQVATLIGAFRPVAGHISKTYVNASVDFGYIFTVLVTGPSQETIAYTPITFFNCHEEVSRKLQHSYPCKYQLPVESVGSLTISDNEVSTVLVETPGLPDFSKFFVVAQCHAQLHRLTVALNLSKVLDVPPLPLDAPLSSVAPNSLSTITARSTGMVVISTTGEFDFFIETYSIVTTPALVMAVQYPRTRSPIPGGCCPGSAESVSSADSLLVSLANATIGVEFDSTNTKVTFYDAAVMITDEADVAFCAYKNPDTFRVEYSLFALSLHKDTSTHALYNALERMYTVDGILKSGASLVWNGTSDRLLHTYTTGSLPGVGRVFGVIAKLYYSGNELGSSAYIPAASYDCSYASEKVRDASSVCKTVLQPNIAYKANISALANASFVLNDWQASASGWTFAVINLHTQRYPMMASSTLPATLDTTATGTSLGFAPLLDPNGGNDQTYIYASLPSSTLSYLTSSFDVNFMIQAIPYGPSVPIPGGCCMTCSMDIDPSLIVSFVGFRTDIQFYQANIGYTASESVSACDQTNSHLLVSNLRYWLYKYSLDYGKFSTETMFDGIKKMSTVENVKKYGTKVGNGDTAFHNNHKFSALARPGRGVVYNVLVHDPRHPSLEAVYSPHVTYGCTFLDNNTCSNLSPLSITIALVLLAILGFFLCVAGHNFYRFELVLIGAFIPLVVSFVALNVLTELGETWLVIVSPIIALVFGLLLLFCWYRVDFAYLFHLIVGLNCGVLVASILFFTPFANISIWHMSVINYWAAFLVITLIVPVITLIAPLYMNIFTTSLFGSFLTILGVTPFIGSSLPMIIVDVVLHVTNSAESDAIYSSFEMTSVEIILVIAWGLLLIAGYIAQLVVHRKSGRPDFPPCPKAKDRTPRRSPNRSRQREGYSSFPDSPPLSPSSEERFTRRQQRPTRHRNLQPIGADDRGWSRAGQRRTRRQQRAPANLSDDRQPLLAAAGNIQADRPPVYGSVEVGAPAVPVSGPPPVYDGLGGQDAPSTSPPRYDPLLVGVAPLVTESTALTD